MKNLIIGAAVGVAATAGAWGLSLLFTDDSKPPALSAEAARPGAPAPAGSPSVVDMICELHLDIEGQLALGIQGNEPSRMALAQVDLDKRSGWYQGKLSISEGRAGNLTTQGSKLVVSRPAMFQRFGVTIHKEEFTIDRATGAFEQSLGLNDGRTVKLIRGTCARVIKPPF